jgi:site-specific DNA-methyltransferase (adenine-specific)
MADKSYNPDVLSCLANLSNDEVFTPPELVNEILNLLPPKLWSDKNTKFLDPAVKTGVFLREITKRLIKGLEKEIPSLDKRIDHIMKKQVFGVAISELTSLLSRRSLYCSKIANSKYSISGAFKDNSGNIIYNSVKHVWKNEQCIYCGAKKDIFNRDISLETYAYEFIHVSDPEQLFNMKFDVIIGNPPYQLDTGGSGRQAKPIYQKFIATAKKLSPKYITMVIPARWYSGGFGLDGFRDEMLNDKKIKNLVDFKSATDVFPGVDIPGGICYFLWDRDHDGQCEVTSFEDEKKSTLKRSLNEFKIFIRNSKAIPIIRKVLDQNKNKLFLNEFVSSIKPFGLPTNYAPLKSGLPCRFIQKIGLKFAKEGDVVDSKRMLSKWKVLIPEAPIAGQTDLSKPIKFYHDKNTLISKPGECCTESWIVAGNFDTKYEAENFKSYLFTKTVRFLILQTVISQDVNRKNFAFVPHLKKYDQVYSDKILKKMWNINEEEWTYIDSKIIETGK